MKKYLIALVLLLTALRVSAQSPTYEYGGNITAGGSDCTVATRCVVINLPANAASLSATVTGTFSATLAFEYSADHGTTWTSLQTTTAATVVTFPVASYTNFRVRASSYASGNAGVDLIASVATLGGAPIPFAGVPSGACTATQLAVDTTTGDLYSCNTGSWAIVGGGGGGTVTSVTGTTNQVDVATGTTTPVVSLDAAIILPGNLTAPTGSTIGTSGSGKNNATEINGVAITGLPIAGEIPSATSASTATWQPLITSGAVSLYSLGVKADGVFLGDVSTTNGSPAISSAGEAAFCDGGATPCSLGQNSSIGQTIVAWSKCQTNQGTFNEVLGTATANPTIISVTDSLHATASVNATATVAGTGCAVYGTLDDTGLSNVDSFLSSTTVCPALLVPAGLILTNSAHLIHQPTICTKVPQSLGATGKGGGGLSVTGVSFNRSIFVLLPAFNFASCTGGLSGFACFGGQQYADWSNLQFTGLGATNTNVAAANNKRGFALGSGMDFHDMQFINFCPKCGAFAGIASEDQSTSGVSGGWNITNDGFGGSFGFLNLSSSTFTGYNIGIQDICGSGGAQIDNAGIMVVVGGFNYAGTGDCTLATSPMLHQEPNSDFTGNILLFQQTVGIYGIRAEDGSTTRLLDKSTVTTTGSGAISLYFPGPSNTAKLMLNNTTVSATAGASTCVGTGSIFDNGGNFGLTGCSNIFGSLSIAGTVLATGNVVLTSGWGTGAAASTFSGGSQSSQWTSTIGTTPSTTAVTTVTFPTPFFSAPTCTAIINGGTSTAVLQTSCSATATAATITYLGTLVSGTVITTLRASN